MNDGIPNTGGLKGNWKIRLAMAGCLIVTVALIYGPSPARAKVKIAPLDYHASWKAYAEKDANRQPAKVYPYEACFKKAAEEFDLPLTLLLALARGESDFNARAKSSKACYGIMQIQWPGTARDLGLNSIRELYDPCKNIRGGAKYIRMMLDRYDGNIHLALAAYNYGPGRIGTHASPASLPQGAVWYSGYVYHHLQQVLAGSRTTPIPAAQRTTYRPGSKLPVILFHNPIRAAAFLAYFKENAADLRLDWFRTSLGETYIVMLFDTDKEKQSGVLKLKQLGFRVDVTNQFN